MAEEKEELQPGEFYSICGKEGGDIGMYVRDENIGGSPWHVFAAFDRYDSPLMRVRIPSEGVELRGDRIFSTYKAVSKVITSSRGEESRLDSISSFIDKAYESSKNRFQDSNEDSMGSVIVGAIRIQYEEDHSQN